MQKRTKNNALNNILEPNKTIHQSPIKEFLIKNSWLVELNEKENLNQVEKARLERIFVERDKTFNELVRTTAKYYHLANKGDYRFDGMPEIKRGIRGWIEDKLWYLLISISEPEQINQEAYWEEAFLSLFENTTKKITLQKQLENN